MGEPIPLHARGNRAIGGSSTWRRWALPTSSTGWARSTKTVGTWGRSAIWMLRSSIRERGRSFRLEYWVCRSRGALSSTDGTDMKVVCTRAGAERYLSFWCPGCQEIHFVRIEGVNPWSFDGNRRAPTISPSVKVESGHYVPGHRGDCWCNYNARHPRASPFECKRCHSFVERGEIRFLSDCTHALAGQTVPLPDVPSAWRERDTDD